MKKFNKLILTVLAVFALALILKVPTQAAVVQTGCTENKIYLSWASEDFTEGGYYDVLGFAVTTSYNEPATYPISPSAKSTTVNAIANYNGRLYLHCLQRSKSDGKYFDDYISTEACTLPSTPSKAAFGTYWVGYSTNKVEFAAKRPSTDHGFCVQLFRGNRALGVYSNSYESSYSPILSISKNTVYQYRIKYWTEIYTGGRYVKYYSRNWSPVRKFDLASFKAVSKSNQKGFKATAPKCAGVSNYTISISKSSSTSGFKYTTKIKPGKKNVRIKKNYKKKTTNYILVTPNISGYGKSDISSKFYLYIYK